MPSFIPDIPVILAFALASFVLAVTPGPDMALFVSRTINHGLRHGIVTMGGALTGIAVHTCLAAFGISVLIVAAASMTLFGFIYAPLLSTGHQGVVLLCLSLGLFLMGLSYGPLGAALGSLFPTAVRYTGASLTFNLAGIVGALVVAPLLSRLIPEPWQLPVGIGLLVVLWTSIIVWNRGRSRNDEAAGARGNRIGEPRSLEKNSGDAAGAARD